MTSTARTRRSLRLLTLSMVTGLVAALTLSAVPAQGQEANRRITVTGSATVAVERDRATTSFGVSVLAASATAAQADLGRAVTTVRNALLAAGATAKRLTTTGLSLYPEYEYVMNERPRLVGYRATLTLQVRSTVPRASDLIDAAVAAGGDSVTVQGISFDATDTTAAVKRLRAAAVRDARTRAETYAAAAGVRVGRVRSIVETSAPDVRPIAIKEQMVGASLPLDSGTQEVSVTISVTFDLQS